MKISLKILSLLLALLMMLPVVLSCGKSDDGDGEASVTTTADTSDGVNPMLPEKDYGEYEFNIVTHENGEESFVTEGYEGTLINDVVYERNLYLGSKYNVSMNVTLVKQSGFYEVVNRSVESGTYMFDLLVPGVSYAYQLGMSGLLYDLSELPVVDYDKPYWWQYVWNDTSIAGNHYIAINDACLTSYRTVGAVLFNKSIAAENHLDDFYTLANEKQWTLAKMIENSKKVYIDTTGNGRTPDDIWGLTGNSAMTDYFYYGSESRLITKDAEDLPVLNMVGNEPLYDIFDSLRIYFRDSTTFYGEDNWGVANARIDLVQDIFLQGSALFWVDAIWKAEVARSGSDVDFGILPMPLVNEGQTEYWNSLHSWISQAICIPLVTSDDMERTGTIIEDMAYYSYVNLRPAFYDTLLKGRVSSDEQSAEMLDYVLYQCRIDPAIYLRESGLSIFDDLRGYCSSDTATSISSILAQKNYSYKKIIERIRKSYEDK